MNTGELLVYDPGTGYPFIYMPNILPEVKYYNAPIHSKNKYEFFHMHLEPKPSYAVIDKHGYCISCERYILPYKMLEVMAALKELNG